MEFKLKKKHGLIAIGACLLIFMVKMCETEGFDINKQDNKDVKSLVELQHESDSLLTLMLEEIEIKQSKYNKELDSLNNIILNDNLTVEEVNTLKQKIKDTQELLVEAENEREVVYIDAGVTISERIIDSVVLNIIEKDSVSIIIRDSIVYNYVDTTIYKKVYKIDTVVYSADEIKKLKIKKD